MSFVTMQSAELKITPENLHAVLYDDSKNQAEDVHIRLNSYGGSCNAAVRMHDDIAAYPGKVRIHLEQCILNRNTAIAE